MSDPQSSLPPLRGDGLPALPTGEPVLARWFVIAMLVLVPVAIGVTVWAVMAIPRGDEVPPAERRPVGDEAVTIDRGDAQLGDSTETEPGPGCAEPVELVGDIGTRAAGRRALEATCELLGQGGYEPAREGLRAWIASGGRLRFATFEVAAVDASSRVEEGNIVLELNARYLFEDARRAAPVVLHQLVLVGDPDWPGEVVTAERELTAAEIHADACDRMTYQPQEPPGCGDVRELLASDDPLRALEEAGFRAR